MLSSYLSPALGEIHWVTGLIIFMKKILDSDWLRAVQLKCNLHCSANYLLFFSWILLIGNHTIFRSIWNNLHLCVFQRAQIAWARCANYSQIELEPVWLPLLMYQQIHTKRMFSFTMVNKGSYGLLIDQSQFTNFTCHIIMLVMLEFIIIYLVDD